MNISCAIINIKLVSLYASFAGNSVTISVQASLGSGLIDFIPTNLCLLLPKGIKPKIFILSLCLCKYKDGVYTLLYRKV